MRRNSTAASATSAMRRRSSGSSDDIRPDVVFHFAAQPLVLASYEDPNRHLRHERDGHRPCARRACARLDKPCAAVMITTDKVYENLNWEQRYRETDGLGGHDPYSASKAAAEIAISSWRRSFLAASGVRVASARAGNVIGAGDWADNRIVPDLVRALLAESSFRAEPARRAPLAACAGAPRRLLGTCRSAGGESDPALRIPSTSARRQTRTAALRTRGTALAAWPGETHGWSDGSKPGAPHEAHYLALSVDRARARLGWTPALGFPPDREGNDGRISRERRRLAKRVARASASIRLRAMKRCSHERACKPWRA